MDGRGFSTMPPVVPFMGFGLTCFLTRLITFDDQMGVILAQRDRAALTLVAPN